MKIQTLYKIFYDFFEASRKYVLTNWGSHCVGMGKPCVDSKDSCKDAAKDLGMIFKGLVDIKILPKGCFEYRKNLPDRWAFWNRSGKRAIRYQYRSICVNGTNFLYLRW